MPVLPRPTSRMTTYLPILSGMRAPGLGSGTDLEAGSVIGWWRVVRDGASGYGVARSSDCDATLTQSAATAAAARRGHSRSAALSAEMLVTGMRELHHTTVAHHDGAGLGAQHADARIAPFLRRQLRGEARDVLRRDRET